MIRTLLLGLALASSLRAQTPEPARLAVVSTAQTADLAALLTTELANNPGVALVERDALAKIGDEARLQQMAGSDAAALGKLANADGLLFIDPRADGPHVRLTAVNLGYAIFDDPVPPGVNPQQEAKALAHLVANDAPKLKLARTAAVPLSVLNLRADFPTPDSAKLERDLTLLLESRLAAVPEYVVLERRHAWSLGFERALDPAAQPLLHGAHLIDGTISSGAAGTCTVAVRIQNPSGDATHFSIAEKSDQLPALADQILASIRKTISGNSATTPLESSQQEAAQYLDEGTWGRRAHANAAALEALDSAELLGAKPADVEVERIPVLYALAEEGLDRWYPSFNDQEQIPKFDSTQLNLHIDAAIRSLQEAALYQSEKMESQADPRLLADPTERFLARTDNLLAWTVYRASKVLLLADRAKAPLADELRQALRPVTGYDPLHGKIGRAFTTNVNNDNSRSQFADNWAQSADEEAAYYRLACADKVMSLPSTTSGWRIDRFCERFYDTPEQRTKAFSDFVDSLKDKPDSRLTYCILRCQSDDPAVADAGYRDFMGELWNIRDQIATVNRDCPLYHNLYPIRDDVKLRNASAALPLLHYLLTDPAIEPWSIGVLRMLWRPQGYTDAEAPQLWAEFTACRDRMWIKWKAGGYGTGGWDEQMGGMADDFRNKFPAIAIKPSAPAATSANALTVTKFWSPGLAPGAQSVNFQIGGMSVCPDGAWLTGFYIAGEHTPALFHVNLADFTSTTFVPPDNFRPIYIAAADKALYCIDRSNSDPTKHQFARYTLPSGPWQTRPLPDIGDAHLFAVNDAPYLFATSKEHDTSMLRYDWDADKWNILASSRRRPGQNQFDDTAPISFFGSIFAGPSHQPCVFVMDGAYYIHETPGPWPTVYDSGLGSQFYSIGDRTLICSFNGEAVMLDANKSEPEYWVANSLPHVRHPAVAGKPLEKVPTPWAAQANWTWATPEKGQHWKLGVAFHDETLFLLDEPNPGEAFELICYRKGDPTPRRIPLQFHMDDATRARLAYVPDTGKDLVRLSIDQLQHPERASMERMHINAQLIGTHQGLCLEYFFNGFWFIPFTDIDAYLKNNPPTAQPPAK
jgi:hypothetical protein